MKTLFILLFIHSSITFFGQTGTEIYLFDMKVKNGQVIIGGGRNITDHKGYDNQPFFHPSKPVIYYSSFNDSGRSDIKYYDYKNNITTNLTLTNEREYSPTVTPDGKYISCIIQRDNGAQDLGKYPMEGGEPEVLINNLVVGYHAWIDSNKLLLFVLQDSGRNKLVYYQTSRAANGLSEKTEVDIARNIGRSLHKIPGQQAMSFVQKITDSTALVTRFDIPTMRNAPIAYTIKGLDQLAWLNNDTMLMSDGHQLFSYRVGTDKNWQPVMVEGDISMLKGVTRLATNGDNNKLAVVVSE